MAIGSAYSRLQPGGRAHNRLAARQLPLRQDYSASLQGLSPLHNLSLVSHMCHIFFAYRIYCIRDIFCTCHIHLFGVRYLRTESSLTLFSALLESSGISETNSSTSKETTRWDYLTRCSDRVPNQPANNPMRRNALAS